MAQALAGWLPKWKPAYHHAKEQGWEFHVHCESRIRDQAFENIKFLERYKRMQFPVEDSRRVIENVRQMGSAPVPLHPCPSFHRNVLG